MFSKSFFSTTHGWILKCDFTKDSIPMCRGWNGMTNDRLKSTAGTQKSGHSLRLQRCCYFMFLAKGLKIPMSPQSTDWNRSSEERELYSLREKLLQQNQGDFLKYYTLHANHFISVNPIQFRDSMHALHLDSSSLILDSGTWMTHLFLILFWQLSSVMYINRHFSYKFLMVLYNRFVHRHPWSTRKIILFCT